MKRAAPLLLAACAMLAFAQDDDPLKSPACAAALDTLQAARGNANAAGVESARAAAAAACLGTSERSTRPARIAQPPVAVPAPRIEPPQAAAPPPAPRLPPPPVAIERAPSPALCDAGGCWTPDGPRLRHVPPAIAGPQGPCTAQGGTVYCP
ncbi:hypothetical protein [Ramlibacter pallidus]|uniref:Uncharacterized protein n=1 Tax=Ramlibacter pallidus TaxID=2780087 RepID=A0ABR9S499_9BURK|nr:hypothetical protein [Ramlibacter pallidus]MBE7368349.1 hypothetical protein [Ramlibacter pallidus]